MLRELYDYALRENLILPPGFVRKPVRAYISLARDGKYVGIIVSDGEKVPCPDIGSMANSSGKCNVLAEKRSILFPGDEKQREKYAAKAAYFHEAMAEAAKAVVDHCGEHILYISVANNLSVDCDCDSSPEDPKMGDIGILASLDPVALDKACTDLVRSSEDHGKIHLIERIDSRHGMHTLDYAEQLGMGSQKYELIRLD